jgi:hypothetical protein
MRIRIARRSHWCSYSWVRFYARHVGSGLWAIWDGAVMSSRATDLGEDEAGQKAVDLHVYSIIRPARHSQKSATWSAAGEVDAAHQAPGLY